MNKKIVFFGMFLLLSGFFEQNSLQAMRRFRPKPVVAADSLSSAVPLAAVALSRYRFAGTDNQGAGWSFFHVWMAYMFGMAAGLSMERSHSR